MVEPYQRQMPDGRIVFVRGYQDKRTKKPDERAMRLPRPTVDAAPTPEKRKGIPAKFQGGKQVPPTEQQLAWAREKHGERLPPGRPIMGEDGKPTGEHTVHGMVTYDPPLNGKILAQWYDGKGKRQDRYTKAHAEAAQRKKHGKMSDFADRLPAVKRAVEEALSLPGFPRVKAIAAAVALVDQTAIRIGGEDNAKRDTNPTYGACTLLKAHVTFEGDHARLSFTGKHNVHQEKTVSGPIVEALKGMRKLGGDRAIQYRDDNGEVHAVTDAAVRDWLKPMGVTPKNWRTYQATKMFTHAVATLPEAKDEKARKKNVVEAVKAVATYLGNTPAVARSQYINPAMIEEYLHGADH